MTLLDSPPSGLPAESLTLAITGTDTGVGKTRFTEALLIAAAKAGVSACGFKPVASGAEYHAEALYNDDALRLQAASHPREPYQAINPYVFQPAIAPHLAAAEAAQPIDRACLDQAYQALAGRHQWVLVEGAGGWRVPFGPGWAFSDWVAGHGWPVILVVGMRLGCINHALLSAESILRQCPALGWIANRLPPEQERWAQNVEALAERMPMPLLGVLGPDFQCDDPLLSRLTGSDSELRRFASPFRAPLQSTC